MPALLSRLNPRSADFQANAAAMATTTVGSSLQVTMQDGSTVTGRIGNMKENTMMVCTNMMDPNNFTNVDARDVVKTEESKVSMMPPGLLNMLKEDDIV